MRNGKYHQSRDRHLIAMFCGILCLFVALVCLPACRSSRNMVSESTTVGHQESESYNANDSIFGESSDSVYRRATGTACSRERGHIDIKRDTAGYPVLISWTVDSNFSGNSTAQQTSENLFTLRGSSNGAKSSGSVDSVNEKKEETQTEVKAGIPLEVRIVCIIAVIVVLFYLGDWIYRLWERHQK